MNLPLQLILLSIPAFIYAAVSKRRRENWNQIFKKLGWQGSRPIYFVWALGVILLTGGLGWLAFRFIPAEVLQNPNVNVSAYQGMPLNLISFFAILLHEAFYVALGEEIFFRGFLGGWLVRRFGFKTGNAIQTLIFLLPHLLLLLASFSFWPILFVQALSGWLMGWLRHRSGSILPGWLAHSLINTLAALSAIASQL